LSGNIDKNLRCRDMCSHNNHELHIVLTVQLGPWRP